MDQETFDYWVTQGYNRIPVTKTILADVEDSALCLYETGGRPLLVFI